MFSIFKKKKIIPHIKLNGVIGNVGKFKQGINFASQEEIIKKAFSIKKAPDRAGMLKQMYEEEFERAMSQDEDRASLTIAPGIRSYRRA